MSGIFAAPAQNPVGETQQNDFREQSSSEAAEHAQWERSQGERSKLLTPSAGVAVPGDTLAVATIVVEIGPDLGQGLGVSEPFRLLANDPTRREWVYTGGSGNLYVAVDPASFQGLIEQVATIGQAVIPGPGAGAGPQGVVLHSTSELWGWAFSDGSADPTNPDHVWFTILTVRGARVQA